MTYLATVSIPHVVDDNMPSRQILWFAWHAKEPAGGALLMLLCMPRCCVPSRNCGVVSHTTRLPCVTRWLALLLRVAVAAVMRAARLTCEGKQGDLHAWYSRHQHTHADSIALNMPCWV
jgi:hypothetical protein